MGCGGSKFDTEGDAVPVRVRPLLRRRIEEIKRRRNANGLKNSTPSKKVLLHNDDHAGEEDDDTNSSPPHSLHDNGRKSVSSPDSVKIIKEHVQEERSLKPEKEETKTGENKKTEDVKSIADSDEDEDDDEEGEYDDEGMLSNDEGYICPASPSFRVYYVESLPKDDNDDHGKNEGTVNESSQGDESIASRNSTEGSVTKIRKKGRKGRNIRRVIHKGGHVAVKNLMNVKSCYNPAASSQVNARLIQKGAA